MLLQIDPDAHCSAFDSIVALDSGVDHLLKFAAASPEQIESIVHGAIFTRSPKSLKRTAIFFGGSQVDACERLVQAARATFFGPMRVSLMVDPNGCNTTAAACVLSALEHDDLEEGVITVASGTGPVGFRIAWLLGKLAAEQPSSGSCTLTIQVTSRSLESATAACGKLSRLDTPVIYEPRQVADVAQGDRLASESDVLFSAAASGVQLFSQRWMNESRLRVAIDVNGVPPAGIAGINSLDCAVKRGSAVCYGAIGIGNRKMRLHRRCLERIFETNDLCLEVDEIFAIGNEK